MTALTPSELQAMRARSISDRALEFWALADAIAVEFGIPVSAIKTTTRGTKEAATARAWLCRIADDRGIKRAAISRFLRRDVSSICDAIAKTRQGEAVMMFSSVRGL